MSSVIVSWTKNKNISLLVLLVLSMYICMCLCEMYHMAMQDLHVHIMHMEYSTGKNTQLRTEKLILLTFFL